MSYSIPEYEQMVIGALINKPEKLVDLFCLVEQEDFFDLRARSLFTVIVNLYRKREDINISSLVDVLGKEISPYIITAMDKGLPSNVVKFAGIIKEHSRRQLIIRRLKEVIFPLSEGEINSDKAARMLGDIYRDHSKSIYHKKDCHVGPLIERFNDIVLKNRESGGSGILTGFEELDREYIQYQPGSMWMIIGYSSTGKTTFMSEMINRVNGMKNGENKTPIVIFSLEMTEEQMVARILANYTGFKAQVLLSGAIHDRNIPKVTSASNLLLRSNLCVYDHIRNIDQLEAEIRRLRFQDHARIVFIDFIQNITDDSNKSKYQMMSDLAVRLQNLFIELRCTGILLSQISNAEAKQDSGIIGAKGAGEFDAAADIAIRLKRSTNDERRIMLETRKNRHGAKPKFQMKFNDSWTGFI